MATITTTARTSYGSLRGVAEDGLVIFRSIRTPGLRSDTSDLRPLSPQTAGHAHAMPPSSARGLCSRLSPPALA
jgi:hypothetical protein